MKTVISGKMHWHVLASAGCCCGIGLAALPACAQDRSPAAPGLVSAARTAVPALADAAFSHVDTAAVLPMNFDVAGPEGASPAPFAEAADVDGNVAAEEEGALDAPAMPRQPWVDDGLKREWSIQPIADGPALEVGALGGGKKKAGRLAHVRVSWAF